MKKMIIALTALFSAVFAFAQANTEVRTVGSFKSIIVSNGIELTLKQGGSESVSVDAGSTEYRDKIKTVVENGVLKIYYDNGKIWKALDKKKKELKAYVSVVTLEKLEGNSGSSVIIDGNIKTSSLELTVSSGSSVKGGINSTDIKADISSGASAKINGSSETITVKSSSGAHFYGYELATQNCNASVSSGGKIEISVNKELDAKASSGGKVLYKGSAVVKSTSINSGGSVQKS